jgi:phage/plasmid-associated DNA primase
MFKNNLNGNQLLIGLKNGVYDLEKCEFREGRQEDYISHTTNCDYIEYSHDSPEIKLVEHHLECFFPNKKRREYVLDILSQIFVGNLYLKHLFLWVGVGDNGKSAFSRWIEEILGRDYFVKLPTTLLTSSKSEAGKAAPELVRLKGKRLAIFDEPDYSESLSNGTLKNLTGRDSIEPRDLFQKGKEIKQ